MAIAYDAISSLAATARVFTWTHTPVGTPKGVLVWVFRRVSTNQVSSVTYGGVTMTDVPGSPNLKINALAAAVHCFFLGSGIPTGPQTVVVTCTTSITRIVSCVTVTSGDNILTTIVNSTNVAIKSDAVANPSSTLTLGGLTCFVLEGFLSGHTATTSMTPFAGWTDLGVPPSLGGTAAIYKYDTVGSSDVTIGWTQTTEDATCIGVSLSDGLTSDRPIWRTLLNQLRQVSGSNAYDDNLDMTSAIDNPHLSSERDLNYVRTQLRTITGAAKWYTAPIKTIATIATDINNLVHSGAISGSLNNIFTFTGMTNRNDNLPSYASSAYVGVNDPLETAIGKLDLALTHMPKNGAMSGSLANIWGFVGMSGNTSAMPNYSSTTVVIQGSNLEAAIGTLDAAIDAATISKSIAHVPSVVISGSAFIIPGGFQYTISNPMGQNMDVYLNGQLMQPNTGSEMRDYIEDTTTTIKFTFNVSKDSYISYLIRK